MVYRIAQIACGAIGALSALMLAVILFSFGAIWTDYGFGGCEGCDAQLSFIVALTYAGAPFVFVIALCALGFWWATRRRARGHSERV